MPGAALRNKILSLKRQDATRPSSPPPAPVPEQGHACRFPACGGLGALRNSKASFRSFCSESKTETRCARDRVKYLAKQNQKNERVLIKRHWALSGCLYPARRSCPRACKGSRGPVEWKQCRYGLLDARFAGDRASSGGNLTPPAQFAGGGGAASGATPALRRR